jgi:hypothetical protein
MNPDVEIFYRPTGPMNNCWCCGRLGQPRGGGPLMICWRCEVLWARWTRPISNVTYAPMYETVLSRCGRRGTAHPLYHLRWVCELGGMGGARYAVND